MSGSAEAWGPDVAEQALPENPLKSRGVKVQPFSSQFLLEDGRQEVKAS